MLLNLHVKNLALIEDVEVFFKDGFNIITGETGAGKSIVLGSVNLAIGNKVSKDMIRKGADFGLVEVVFETISKDVIDKVHSLDIPFENNQIIISRKITNGRSITKVNGVTVSASMLKEITSLLIDIHGQHDHESLLQKTKHMEILDNYNDKKIIPLKEEMGLLYSEYKNIISKLGELNVDEDLRAKELSFLEFQINEIEESLLKDGEDVLLEEEFKKINNSKGILEVLNNINNNIFGESHSFFDIIGQSTRELGKIVDRDKKLSSFYDALMDVDSICTDLGREINDYIDEMTFDEEKMNTIVNRLDLINKLKLKYGRSFKEINITLDRLLEEYNVLKNSEKEKERLNLEKEKIEKKLCQIGNALSLIRKETALILEKDIVDALLELNFVHVNFKVEINRTDNFSPKGMDKIQFMISLNSGEELKPLDEVASGGELSRIMLALKSITAGKDNIDTLIFDEIDTGISGRTAQKVSERLKYLSKDHQLIVITHLPQIASMADNHYIIEKNVIGGDTYTEVRCLDDTESIKELARMLGGAEITKAVFENAKEMKEMAMRK